MKDTPEKLSVSGARSESLDAIVLKAMAKNPAERFQSMAEMAHALVPDQNKPPEKKAGFVDQLQKFFHH